MDLLNFFDCKMYKSEKIFSKMFDKIRIPIYLQVTNSIKHSNSYSMKKIFAAVAIVALFASCKKDYTCDCTILGQTTSTPINDAKKADAEDACDALGVSAALLGGSCTLN